MEIKWAIESLKCRLGNERNGGRFGTIVVVCRVNGISDLLMRSAVYFASGNDGVGFAYVPI